ncbi:hypothetical protein B0H14DRAFT_3001503 [Mycena olivaceomarginata]|nr:hypothetical protein B0H14DRAFT_3001503 [Mycena olivaceomarginata]
MCATTAATTRSPVFLSFVSWYSLSLSATYSLCVCLDDIPLPFRSFLFLALPYYYSATPCHIRARYAIRDTIPCTL